MRKPFNKDGAPRKLRRDCKFFALPVEGQDEFLAHVNAHRAGPNVEELRAICARHGVEWSAKGIYDFLQSDRITEQLITGEVRANVRLGQELAAAGGDKLTAAGRAAAAAHWTTVIRAAKFMLLNPDATAQERRRAEEQIAEATDKLVALGYGEDSAKSLLLKEAKLKLDERALAQAERRLRLLEEKAAQAKAALNRIVSKGGLTRETLSQIEEAANLL